MARNFQYEVEVFSKEVILDGPLRKTKYYAIHIESQERGSPYVQSFIWVFNAPNIENKPAYTELIEKTINAQLPDNLPNPELFELVRTYQVHAHSRNSWKYNKNKYRFSFGKYFTKKTIIPKLRDYEISSDEKQEVVTWRNTLLKQIKSYVDNNFNPVKVSVTDPTKENFTRLLSIKEIPVELEISKNDY